MIKYVLLIILLLLSLVFLFHRQVEKFKLQDDPMIVKIKEVITPFLKTYSYNGKNGIDVIKKIKIYKGDKSYTINKERIYLCLKDENNNYYNKNMLIYVILHELAHVFSDSIGHTEEFNIVFQDILDKAHKFGIYNPSIPILEDYCKYNIEDEE